jgi:hypothetical protein
MDFSGILIGSAQPQRLVEYYTKLFGTPAGTTAATSAGPSAAVA